MSSKYFASCTCCGLVLYIGVTIKYKNGRCGVQTRYQVHPVLFITKHGSTKRVQYTEVYINYMDVSLCSKRSNKSQVKSWLLFLQYSTWNHRPPSCLQQPVVDSHFGNFPLYFLSLEEVAGNVRIHNPVWKFLVSVLISLNVRVLVLISCLKPFHNPATTSGKQRHSRENFVQNQGEIQKRDCSHEVKKLDRKR